jgi:hypothetical protein
MTDRTALMRQIALRKLADLREEAGKDGVALSQHRAHIAAARAAGAEVAQVARWDRGL